MRISSLFVLGAVFMIAFAGRAAVLAAKGVESSGGKATEAKARCIDGSFAEELLAQSEKLEVAAVKQKAEDQKRAVLSEHIEKRINELERLNVELSAQLEKSREQAAQTSNNVATLYERMKPDLAGAIIGEMDPKFAAGLLKSMNADSASAILAAVGPARAYAITVLMTEPS
jgi:flagellar motility protein MotE (MotC chaperone)